MAGFDRHQPVVLLKITVAKMQLTEQNRALRPLYSESQKPAQTGPLKVGLCCVILWNKTINYRMFITQKIVSTAKRESEIEFFNI